MNEIELAVKILKDSCQRLKDQEALLTCRIAGQDARERAWNEAQERSLQDVPKDARYHYDVSGKLFWLETESMLRFPESVFAARARGNFKRDDIVYLARDPHAFGIIHHMLITGKWSDKDYNDYKEEFDYFCISKPVPEKNGRGLPWKWDKLLHGEFTDRKLFNPSSYVTAFATGPSLFHLDVNNLVYRWDCRIQSEGECKCRIGLSHDDNKKTIPFSYGVDFYNNQILTRDEVLPLKKCKDGDVVTVIVSPNQGFADFIVHNSEDLFRVKIDPYITWRPIFVMDRHTSIILSELTLMKHGCDK